MFSRYGLSRYFLVSRQCTASWKYPFIVVSSSDIPQNPAMNAAYRISSGSSPEGSASFISLSVIAHGVSLINSDIDHAALLLASLCSASLRFQFWSTVLSICFFDAQISYFSQYF